MSEQIDRLIAEDARRHERSLLLERNIRLSTERMEGLTVDEKIKIIAEYWIEGMDDLAECLAMDLLPEERREEIYHQNI